MNRIMVNNVSKKFKIGFKKKQSVLARFISIFSGKEPKRELKVLQNVSFQAHAGEIIGIIGENGSGKSTLLRIIAGIYDQDQGSIEKNGNLISLIGLGPGLKDRLSMKDNIYLIGSFFGLTRKTIQKRFHSIVKLAGLSDFVNTKIYQFSQGMLQRLVFSIAVHCDPQILLLDEVFEVGDEEFRKRSVERIKELVENGATTLLVSHELGMIEKYCHKVIWLGRGEIIKEGKPKRTVKEYLESNFRRQA